MNEVANEEKYTLLLSSGNTEDERLDRIKTMVFGKQVDGLIFLYSKINEADYDDFVRHCLDCNLAVSPAFDIPSIVPYGADKGVFSLLKNNPWKKGL